MKFLDDRIIWSHGTLFKLRRVKYARDEVRFWKYRRPYSHNIGTYIIFGPRGQFLCRIHPKQLKRWLNYYGLQFLKGIIK